ncbi:hypothetical protein GCM10011515_24050 [Tsuneonella deserti]|uniref:Uncharacterized protein n=1 Tax=Tsuneonella deserti TaxID=2035528 RepID=A0ABQ1SDI4_9SPHN|nr:hypothetical protein [Tsuneonella deserti]GGE03626.1 hypothetical protein GCM10011515_24050 [Tsuneonella deserti]
MPSDWDEGLIGNNQGRVFGLAKRESLAKVMVRAFRPIQARRHARELPAAA